VDEEPSFDNGVSFFYAYHLSVARKEQRACQGTPAITPDLMTRMTLLAEAMAKYAEMSVRFPPLTYGKKLPTTVCAYLVETYGRMNALFVAHDGTAYESDSLLCCMPILLQTSDFECAEADAKRIQ
jgi:hypothetical protein